MIIIGIDPGLKGGMACWNTRETAGLSRFMHGEKHPNGNEIITWIKARCIVANEYDLFRPQLCIENPGPTIIRRNPTVTSPYDGVTREMVGAFRMMGEALEWPHELVHPRTWQAAMLGRVRRGPGETKRAALRICHELWPGDDWGKRHDDEMCGARDAMLIAEWAARRHGLKVERPITPVPVSLEFVA